MSPDHHVDLGCFFDLLIALVTVLLVVPRSSAILADVKPLACSSRINSAWFTASLRSSIT
jgi:hypothetical protein